MRQNIMYVYSYHEYNSKIKTRQNTKPYDYIIHKPHDASCLSYYICISFNGQIVLHGIEIFGHSPTYPTCI